MIKEAWWHMVNMYASYPIFQFGDSAVSKEILLGDHVYYILQARNNFLFKC